MSPRTLLKLRKRCQSRPRRHGAARRQLWFICVLSACTETVVIHDEPDTTETEDFCASSDMPVITLGQGVGGNFNAYGHGQDVTLTPAPQGGFGISSILRTQGLATGTNLTTDAAFVNITLDVEIDGHNEGTFFVEEVSLLCSDPAFGGLLTGVVAGFDPGKYTDNDDLLSLDGELVDILASVADERGNVASIRQPVTVRVGGAR